MTPTISVVIPTRHRPDLLARCLDRLAPGAQSLSVDHYEVIVTDDSDDDRTRRLLTERYPWCRYTPGPRRGPAANRNRGASLAWGRWLAFTDDDCVPDVDWLEQLRSAGAGCARALEGAVHPLGDTGTDLADCPVNLKGGCFWSANIAVDRELFGRVGGFDGSYPLAAHEDVDLRFSLEPLTEIRFVPDAIVRHPVRHQDLFFLLRQVPSRSAAWAHHVRKHRERLGFSKLSVYAIVIYREHFANLRRHVKQRRWRSAALSMVMLLYGVPLTILKIGFGS